MVSGFSYENRVADGLVSAQVPLVSNTRRKASDRVGLVTGGCPLVSNPGVLVSGAWLLVSTPVLLVGTRGPLVSRLMFKGPGTAPLVTAGVGLVSTRCVNVRPGAPLEGNADQMVSEACIAAGAGLERVSTRSPGAPRRTELADNAGPEGTAHPYPSGAPTSTSPDWRHLAREMLVPCTVQFQQASNNYVGHCAH
jgi:hypothetical protein